MVRRYFNRTSPNKSAQTLQDEMLNKLRQQSETLMNQLARQFADNLEALQKQAAQSLTDAASGINAGGGSGDLSVANARLFTTAFSFLLNRPRAKTSTVESSRSISANDQFRLSQSQMFAEASQALQTGEKNR